MAGMTRVVLVQDSNIPQKYQELLRKVEDMGGRKIGRHVIHCRLFHRKVVAGANAATNQRMYMLRMSQNDGLVYAVLVNERVKGNNVSENGLENPTEECILLECGLDGANILQQVEIYAFKNDGQFEGTQYVLGDLTVSICTFISRSNIPRGLLLEVHYSPAHSVAPLDGLFDEFFMQLVPLETLRKPIQNLHGTFEKVGLTGDYTLKHTALQYVAAFNILRRVEK